MFNFLKKLFCKHKFEYIQTIKNTQVYSDFGKYEKVHRCDLYICKKCKKREARGINNYQLITGYDFQKVQRREVKMWLKNEL